MKRILMQIFVLVSLPMFANDYLRIYFKDGHTERHYMHLVENISVTKYDLDGNLHSDYQMQQIVMADTTYSYYLSDIDSMSFSKVDEEQLKSRVGSVQSSLEPIFEQCSTVEDLAMHIDEIKSIDGVEEVWSDGKEVVIQIRDWLEISFSHQPLPANTSSYAKSLNRQIVKCPKRATKDDPQMKVVIGFQMDTDNKFAKSKEIITDKLYSDFSSMGSQPDYYLGEKMDFDFFYSRIFDSNVLIIDTHGGCGLFNKKHYLYTGIETEHLWSSVVGLEVLRGLGVNVESIDLDDIGITCCEHDDGGLFGEKWFWTVKEDFIRKSPYRFSGPGPHIVFVGACSSLQGNNQLTRSDKEKPKVSGSDSFAQVFFDKGADVYLGYNRGTCRASWAVWNYFDYMLHGASAQKAFIDLMSICKYEYDSEEKAYLVDLYNKNSDNPKGIFLVNTNTVEKTNQDCQTEYNNNGIVELVGKTSRNVTNRSGDFYAEEIDFDSYYGYLNFGFRIATSPKVDKLTTYEEVNSDNAHYSGLDNCDMAFSSVFKPTPGKTYYYRAFTNDGLHYNWGEEKIFKIEDTPAYPDLQLSSSEINLEVGNSGTVEITSGNDSYTVESSDPSVATATLSGNTITIEALKAGQTTITVIDTESSQTATIAVTVTQGGSFLEGQIVMTRKIKVHHKSYNHPGITFWFDNNQLLTIGYFDTNYWGGSYSNSMKGIHIRSLPTDENNAFGVNGPERQTKDWYVSPVILDEWFTEKLVINADGRVQYYLNDEYMGEEVFNDLNLSDASSFKIEMSPWGWWTGHYTYMDDFFLSTPAVTISDNFNDGVIDLSIWKEPTNLDGVREEDGIIKMEQLRTDENFCLYIENIPLKDGSDVPLPSTIKVEPEEIDFGQVPIGSSKTMCFTVSNVGTSNLTFSISETHGDIDIPDSGKEYTLTSGDSKIIKVVFTPTNAYSSTGCSIRIFSDADNGTQYINIIGEGTGKIENGDFSSGTDGFISDYIYVSQPDSYSDMWSEGRYAVGKSPKDYHARFINHGDHTTGNGNMLIVNGSTDDNKYVWKKSFIIKKGVTYEFSAWFLSVSDNTPLDKTMIEYNINGVANMGTYDKIENDWVRYYWRYTAPESGTIEIKIRTKSTDSGGNDFAIDDIFFSNLYTFDD